MRALIFISEFVLFLNQLTSEFEEFLNIKYFLIGGLILIIGFALPVVIIDRVRQSRKIDKIIGSYKGSQTNKKTKYSKGDTKTKGWGMNNSPFRDRKSGLTWGGGNIKGANATRGTRKSFFK